MDSDFVNFNVGGISYSMLKRDVQKYPESYLNVVIKKEWNSEQEGTINIERNGPMFHYIAEFHTRCALPTKDKAVSADLVKQIQVEADFYNLPTLVEECEQILVNRISDYLNHDDDVQCKYYSRNKDDLVNVLGSIWAPFCIKGVDHFRRDITVHKSSTLLSLNIDELCAAAAQAPFGKGTESLVDPSVRDALEIAADQLNPELWKQFQTSWYGLQSLAPRMNLELRPYKLVIYKEGGHFTEHRDSVRGENHVGTLVHILDSKFTGGELVVRQNDKEVSISKPGEWIAMYGDALHRIEPVITGTRVALIFDLVNVGALTHEEYFEFEGRSMGPAEDNLEREVSNDTSDKIYTALDNELNRFDYVVICLTHLYPLCQADPACLKGGDALLYELLAQHEKEYELSIVPVKVQSVVYHQHSNVSEMYGAVVDLDYELSDNLYCDKGTLPTLLVIPMHCTSNHVLSYDEYIEHVGNEPQPEETMYLVTGLRICRREVPTACEEEEFSSEEMEQEVVDSTIDRTLA